MRHRELAGLTNRETLGKQHSPFSENYTLSQFDASTMVLLINPRPSTTTMAFIVGPLIRTRTLQLPPSIIHAFLRRNRLNIGKCGREMMTLYPPANGARRMCLCLTEVVTDVWKSVYIRAERKPDPLPLAWKSGVDGLSGSWTVCEVPNSLTIVRGGFASCQVRSNHALF